MLGVLSALQTLAPLEVLLALQALSNLVTLQALPTLPVWWPWGEADYWLVRFLLQRGLAAIYLVAFLVAARQFRPLAGEGGLLPLGRYVEATSLRDRPSLFHIVPSDRAIGAAAWLGVGLAAAALLGLPDLLGTSATMLVWAAMWLLYLSFVNAGQTFYGFGWETMLLEAGFLAIFLGGPEIAAPAAVIWLFRWLLFRNMLGAGLIKLRGDECWRDLTCLDYHYETQPMPNPVSWYVHHLPHRFHRVGVIVNHAAEVALPFLYFAPQPFAAIAGVATIAFQGWLILTGNFSWLNWLTAVLALSTFSDGTLAGLADGVVSAIPDVVVSTLGAPVTVAPTPLWLLVLVGGLIVLVLALSYWPARNLVSGDQRMNASFDPLHLVNTYGAFGSITKTRRELVLQGTDDDVVGPETEWESYEIPGKPTDPARRPPQIAPYHHRLGWQLWFAAMSPPRRNPWLVHFLWQLLEGDDGARSLLRSDPFPDESPTHVRVVLYRYRFTTPTGRDETGQWWHRERVDTYLGPIERGDERTRRALERRGLLG